MPACLVRAQADIYGVRKALYRPAIDKVRQQSPEFLTLLGEGHDDPAIGLVVLVRSYRSHPLGCPRRTWLPQGCFLQESRVLCRKGAPGGSRNIRR